MSLYLNIFYNQNGIAVKNPAYTPLDMTDAILDMGDADFKVMIKAREPEIVILEEHRWRVLSMDECRLNLNTHDEGSNGRNCERVIMSGPDDHGEVLSAKSASSMSALGGSHANLQPTPAFFSFTGGAVDPAWMIGAPSSNINGIDFQADYSCNEKGSILPEVRNKYRFASIASF